MNPRDGGCTAKVHPAARSTLRQLVPDERRSGCRCALAVCAFDVSSPRLSVNLQPSQDLQQKGAAGRERQLPGTSFRGGKARSDLCYEIKYCSSVNDHVKLSHFIRTNAVNQSSVYLSVAQFNFYKALSTPLALPQLRTSPPNLKVLETQSINPMQQSSQLRNKTKFSPKNSICKQPARTTPPLIQISPTIYSYIRLCWPGQCRHQRPTPATRHVISTNSCSPHTQRSKKLSLRKFKRKKNFKKRKLFVFLHLLNSNYIR